MTSFIDRLWIPVPGTAATGADLPREDEALLGFESAHPSLQLEGWEPASHGPAAAQAAGSS